MTKEHFATITYKRNVAVFVFILAGVFLLLRVLRLDADLPGWGIINYQPMDEGQYATMALNEINYGSFRVDLREDVDSLTESHIRNDFVGNLFACVGLRLFGDNYYGLRLPVVFTSIIIFGLFALVMLRLKKLYGIEENCARDRVFMAFLLLLTAIDFSFVMASRVMEPTIFRLLFLMLGIYAFVIFPNRPFYREKIRFFLIGFLATVSVFLVYITNIFWILSSSIMVLLLGKKRGRSYLLNAAGFYIAGCGIGYVISEVYYYFFWGESCLINSMRTLNAFAGTQGYTGGTLFSIGKLVINFFSANYNLYNLGILLLFLCALPVVMRKAREREELLYILCTFFCFGLQLFITEDYVVRKYILVFPLMIFVIYAALLLWEPDWMNKLGKYVRIRYGLYFLVCLGMLFAVVAYRLFLIDNQTQNDFCWLDQCVVIVQLFFVTVFVGVLLRHLFWKREGNAGQYRWIWFLLAGSFLINGYYDVKYVLLNDSYTEKQVMIDLGECVGDDYVYGTFSASFTLYNDVKPVMNTYRNLRKQIEKKDGVWYLDYENYGIPPEILDRKKMKWEEFKSFDREYSTFGEKRNVSIYRVRTK